ncbi:hypothetical protein DL89DRAFT_289716 [Linderina pennispora]|uniref:Uncharacterized protein n=1 Tax=Linderina pennispora TaxID=61395 RepID=A0A1Y1WL82_9FUNG|nr:uncharacterized protein DL89DRAFT_289716 [Linderina pennispora]ORX74068.1 hypothetical protein DL89DRAFT_289716 [Linderina pennispora]
MSRHHQDTQSAVLEVLEAMSREMGGDLTQQQISAAMRLLSLGLNPEALSAITLDLRRQASEQDSAQRQLRQNRDDYAPPPSRPMYH